MTTVLELMKQDAAAIRARYIREGRSHSEPQWSSNFDPEKSITTSRAREIAELRKQGLDQKEICTRLSITRNQYFHAARFARRAGLL